MPRRFIFLPSSRSFISVQDDGPGLQWVDHCLRGIFIVIAICVINVFASLSGKICTYFYHARWQLPHVQQLWRTSNPATFTGFFFCLHIYLDCAMMFWHISWTLFVCQVWGVCYQQGGGVAPCAGNKSSKYFHHVFFPFLFFNIFLFHLFNGLCFSQSQWRQRLLTSLQASPGSLVGSLQSISYSFESQRDCGLWQQVGDAEVEQANRHWRPTHHTFHHPGQFSLAWREVE